MGTYHKTVKVAKDCLSCGVVFTPVRRESVCCSKPCFDKHLSETRKAERRAKFESLPEINCKHCQKLFVPVQKSSFCCSYECTRQEMYARKTAQRALMGLTAKKVERLQSPEHVKKRTESLKSWVASQRRVCIKCGIDFQPTSAAQKYCSGMCWNSVSRKKKAALHRISVTPAKRQELTDAQNNRCAICDCEGGENNRRDQLAIDHCHASGKIRGLLCHRCNTAIGLFKDNINSLMSAIKYLKERS